MDAHNVKPVPCTGKAGFILHISNMSSSKLEQNVFNMLSAQSCSSKVHLDISFSNFSLKELSPIIITLHPPILVHNYI